MRHPKSIYARISLVFLWMISLGNTFAQCPEGPGLFINEVYQDNASEVEWIEFVVVGDPANPTDPVNLAGWLFDDNNGDFTTLGVADGLTQGSLGFGGHWSAVAPGDIIVVYNENHRDPLLPPDDHLDGNNDGIYIVSGNHWSLYGCSDFPSIVSSAYLSCDGSPPSWDYIDLDDQDVVQVIKADKSRHHAIAFGAYDVLPTIGCGAAITNIVNGGVGRTIQFDCGDWTNMNNFGNLGQGARSPADINANKNLVTIAKIRTGIFDYSNADVASHCNDSSISELPTLGCTPGAGLVINEVSIGSGAAGEWVELLVVGDPSDPLAPVNLSGWIIDDNNGDFEGSGTDKGIDQGAIGLGSHWFATPPGSLIVIYDQNDKDTRIPADDVYDADDDGVYIISADHWSLYGCDNTPNETTTSYNPCSGATASWDFISLDDSGDAIQTRHPVNNEFYHGFSYGDVTNLYPAFPCLTFSWHMPTLSLGGIASLQCGDWQSSDNYIIYDRTRSTPGRANSRDNVNMIANVIIGELDYSNFDNPANCIYEPPCYMTAVSSSLLAGYDHIRQFEIERGAYVNSTIEALDYNTHSDSLFGAEAGMLIYIDKSDATSVNIGPFNPSGTLSGAAGALNINEVVGIAYEPIAKIWFGIQRIDEGTPCGGADVMFQFDINTGQFKAGAFGGSDYVVVDQPSGDNCLHLTTDIAYDPFDEILYGVAIGEGIHGGTSRLVEIDMATGNTVDLGLIRYDNGSGPINIEQIHGISVTSDHRFFVNTSTVGSSSNTLFELTNVTSGAGVITADKIDDLIFDDYQSLTCQTLGDMTTIGGYIVIDDNNSSSFDDTDSGLSGILIELRRRSTDELLASTTTDASGFYEFPNLFPSDYYVVVTSINFNAGNVLENYNNVFDPESNLDNIGGSSGLSFGDSDYTLNIGYSLPIASTSTLTFQKTVSDPNPDPNVAFNFIIDAACNSTTGDCEDVVIRDTLPGTIQFLNFSFPLPIGVASAAYDPVSREVVVLFDNDDLSQGSSISLLLQVLFPTGTLDGAQAINTAYISSSNAGSLNSSATATVASGIAVGDFPNYKSGDDEVIASGEQYWAIELGNIGFGDIDNYEIVDTIPDDVLFTQSRSPEFPGVNHTGDIYYQRSDIPGTWFHWYDFNLNSRQTNNVTGLGLPPGERVTMLRLELGSVSANGLFNPHIYPDRFARRWVLYGNISNTLLIGDSYTNCATYTGTSGGIAITDRDCLTTEIIVPENAIIGTGYPNDLNEVETSTFSLEDTILFAIDFASPVNMGFDVVGSVLTTILPPGLEYIPGTWYLDWGEDNVDYQTPIIETEVLLDGRELIRFVFDSSYSNSFTIPPNGFWEGFRIYYKIFINPATIEGNHPIEYYYNATGSTHDNCDNTDTDNYLGGYNTTHCNFNYDITIVRPPSSAGLQSFLEVLGTLDTDYSRYPDVGLTVPGGLNDYKLTLRNPNASVIDEIKFVTVLPRLGDTDVLDPLVPRYSLWQPYMVGEVPPIPGLTVEYSTVVNPCRDDLAGSNPIPFPILCNSPSWSASPPLDITSVTAIKFSYAGELALNDSIVVSWPMRAPVNTLPDASIAWNSFAYIGRNKDTGSDLLPAEPVKVGVELRPGNVPIVGDFVWHDINENGLQDLGEPGIDNVLIELFHDVNNNGIQEPDGPDTLELYTRSAFGGAYLFSDFDFGRYFLIFSELPTGYNPTLTEIGPDNLDSEGTLTQVILFDNTTDNKDVDLGLITGVPTPFVCTTDIYMATSTSSSASSQLYNVESSNAPFELDPIGTSSIYNYNALGYRDQDGYLYAIILGTNQLVRIDAIGNQTNLGSVLGLSNPASINQSFDAGDVFPDGYLYIHEVGNNNEIHQIDVTSSPPSLVATHILSQNIRVSDFAYNINDDKVYGVGDLGDKFMINPSTWTVSTIGSTAPATTYGAAYTDINGNVYVYRNSPGAFYHIDFGVNGSGTGDMTLISLGPDVDFNDGASCRGVFVLPELCNNNLDDNGNGLVDCYDCESCSDSSFCSDNDNDGIGDFCDLDDDNDGIPDLVECPDDGLGPELVVNGDFENGYAHWTSDFNRGRNNNGPTRDGCSTQGWVAISPCASADGSCNDYYSYLGSTPDGNILITDPIGTGANILMTSNCNVSSSNCLAESLPDHTTGSGISLYVDPSDIPGRSYYKHLVPVQANTEYEFSAWLMVIEEDPTLQFKIDGVGVSAGFNLDRQTPGINGPDLWQRFFTRWNSGVVSGLVSIELVNLTAGCAGNDLRLDDVSLREVINNCDCDGDNVSNHLDLDSDNDGIYDVIEAGHSGVDADNDGLVDASFSNLGENGLYDGLETLPDNGIINYNLADSEVVPDGLPDICELDSDGDGCFDAREEGISDPDNDGLVGTGTPTPLSNGLVSGHTYGPPANYLWQDPSLFKCLDITGRIFEDINYGGGNGRDYNVADASAVSSGWSTGIIGLANVRVELYNNLGAFESTAMTDAAGDYTLTDLSTGSYTVRVVSNTISSNRASNATGQIVIPVQTYRHTGASAIVNEVGGADPALVDANANTTNTNLFSLTSPSTVGQSVSNIVIGGSDLTGVDFGFNYDVIVNVNDAGQGSLRQFILNSNEFSNVDLDQEDNPTTGVSFIKDPGVETSIFMIPGAGPHTITPTSVLRSIRDDYTHLSGYTQSGSSQGDISARTYTIELKGNTTVFDGLTVAADDVQISGLVVNEFRSGIISSTSVTDMFVWGNYVGTDITGIIGQGNSSNGVILNGASSSFIGINGDGVNDENEGNLVADSDYGIQIRNTSNILIAGNIVGLSKNGNAALGHAFNGIFIRDATGPNVVGFDDNAVSNNVDHFRNVSSANGNDGVRIVASSNQIIAGNYLGTDVTGTIPFGNTNYGIQLQGASSDNIFGTDADGNEDLLERNVISSNGSGIRFLSSGTGANNRISGNYIGVSVTGNNDLGNTTGGIEINGDYTQVIIGTNGDNINDVVERNVISGNADDGIRLDNADNNLIAGNFIGLGADGITAIPNDKRGIFLALTSSDNIIGFDPSMANQDELIVGNRIKNNGDTGIAHSGSGTQNRISRNQLENNGTLGIDLGYDFVTSNDNGDGDNGANDLLNFPVFNFTSLAGDDLTIRGFAPAGSVIELFIADAGPSPSPLPASYSESFGEGATYLLQVIEGSAADLASGTAVYSNDGTGAILNRTQSQFQFTVDVAGLSLSEGMRLTATATDSNNNTSEFSGVFTILSNCGTATTNPHIMYFGRN